MKKLYYILSVIASFTFIFYSCSRLDIEESFVLNKTLTINDSEVLLYERSSESLKIDEEEEGEGNG